MENQESKQEEIKQNNESSELSQEEYENLLEQNWTGKRDEKGERIESDPSKATNNKSSKLKRLAKAAVAGAVLGNVTPVMAESADMATDSFFDKGQDEIEHVESNENNQEKAFYEDEDFKNLYERANPEQQKLIEKMIAEDLPADDFEEAEKDSNTDFGLLSIQQQIRDQQRNGEMAPKVEGGVKLPFDEGYDEYQEKISNASPEDQQLQDVLIEKATPAQLYHWIKYLKNKKEYKASDLLGK